MAEKDQSVELDALLGDANGEDQGMELQIDEELLAAAVASVDRANKRSTHDTAALEARINTQSEQIAKLYADLKRTEAARKELEEQSRGLAAQLRERAVESEQLRVRMRRDREDAERATEERMLRALLDVYDNLDRAWFHAMSDPEHVLPGLQMIHDQLTNWLKRSGAERVHASEGAFDPAVHEAVMYRASTDVPANHVVEELSSGFRFRGRLLRPARVVVSSS